MQRIVNARVVNEGGVLEHAAVVVRAGRIEEVLQNPARRLAENIDLGGAYLLPGFVDVHVHPQFSGSPSQSMAELSQELSAVGVAGILWTVANLPAEGLIEMAAAVRNALADPPEDCRIFGIHFEGPYLSPTSRGAFIPENVVTPAKLPLQALLEAGGPAVKYLSLSPDAAGALNVIEECRRRGIRVGMGHSQADVSCLEKAVQAGATSVIHTFNNTPDYPMKEPGVRGVTVDEFSMASSTLCNEVVCDGIHVDPVLVRMLFRAKGSDRVMLITDSVVGGAFRPDGYIVQEAGEEYVIRGGVGRNAQGQMCGSALTMGRAFRNFVRFTGASLSDVVRATSSNAARFLGVENEFGRIAPGFLARFAAMDENLSLCMDRLGGLNCKKSPA